MVSAVPPAPADAPPMHRIFQDERGNELTRLELRDYGYDVRNRGWYQNTLRADQPTVSSPYRSFSIGSPMMTLAAPLRGHVRGVIAADLKLDNFGELVNAQRPGTHGTAIVFDAFGILLAHPD